MKNSLTTILIFGLIIGCTQSTDIKNESDKQTVQTNKNSDKHQNDTLTIIDSDLTVDPFDLGNDPLNRLTSIDNFHIDFQTFENRHVDDQIDTAFQITIQGDYFEVYKTASENWLIEAIVTSDNFQTNQNIKVGMTKGEIKEKLNLTENDLPNSIRLKSLEVLQWIDLKFKKDTLTTIEFKGYVD